MQFLLRLIAVCTSIVCAAGAAVAQSSGALDPQFGLEVRLDRDAAAWRCAGIRRRGDERWRLGSLRNAEVFRRRQTPGQTCPGADSLSCADGSPVANFGTDGAALASLRGGEGRRRSYCATLYVSIRSSATSRESMCWRTRCRGYRISRTVSTESPRSKSASTCTPCSMQSCRMVACWSQRAAASLMPRPPINSCSHGSPHRVNPTDPSVSTASATTRCTTGLAPETSSLV